MNFGQYGLFLRLSPEQRADVVELMKMFGESDPAELKYQCSLVIEKWQPTGNAQRVPACSAE
jgi:hypothetical protein